MGKSEVYSWRISADTKAALEHEARREGVSLAGLLERISQDWLQARQSENGADAAEQKRLHSKAAKLIGSMSGGDPERSSRSRDLVRERLARRRPGASPSDAAGRPEAVPSSAQSTKPGRRRPTPDRSTGSDREARRRARQS